MFKFKEFSIEQDEAPFKVGTDSVILGSWTRLNGDETILDIGTGTGILALMLAQRLKSGHVLALEPEREAYLIAEQNFIQSNFSSKLVVVNEPLQKVVTSSKFDLIITNPPYFIDSTKNSNSSSTRARHTVDLTFTEIIDFSFKHLTESGRLNVVLPLRESELFKKEALHVGFFKTKELLIHSFEDSGVKRVCSEYTISSTTLISEELFIRNRVDNSYSEGYRNLTSSYHTHY